MAATRIHGHAGHLIVQNIDCELTDDGDDFGFVTNDFHWDEARAIFQFFENHVSIAHTVKRLYWLLKREFPRWDSDPRWDSEEEPEGL